MPATYFTLEQANQLLPQLEPLMRELLNRRAKVVVEKKKINDIIDDTYSNVGNEITSQLTQEFMAIDKLIKKIRSYGCEVKDLNVGLLDFLSIILNLNNFVLIP